MNPIPQRQNEPKQLQRLGAQRALYSKAKRVFVAQLILAAPIGVLWAIVVAFFPSLKALAALSGIAFSIAEVAWLNRWQKKLREAAANIQEIFDCEVLEIPWNELKAGKRPDPELVKEYADAFAKQASQSAPLVDWYPVCVGNVDLDVARLICQRTNCWWDAKQRRKYASWVMLFVAISFATASLVGIIWHFTVDQFLLAVVAPLAPTLILGVRQFSDQIESASRLDRLKEHAEKLWVTAMGHPKDCEMVVKSRGLQDEILENRRRSPLIFDWIFKRIRSDYEAQMTHGAEDLVAEVLKKQ